MSFSGIGLTFAAIAGVLWASLDVLRKHLSSRLSPLPLTAALAVAQLPFFLGAAWFTQALWSPKPQYWLPGLSAIAVSVLGNVLFLASMRAGPLGLTIPFLSFSPVFSALSAWVLVGERPSLLRCLGLPLVTLGAFLVGASRSGFSLHPASWLMAATALVWSIASALERAAVDHVAIPVHGALESLGIAGVATVLWLFWGRSSRSSVQPTPPNKVPTFVLVLLTAALAALAIGLQLAAMKMTQVSYVDALKRVIGLTSTLLVGRFLLKEHLRKNQWFGVLLMGAGALTVILG